MDNASPKRELALTAKRLLPPLPDHVAATLRWGMEKLEWDFRGAYRRGFLAGYFDLPYAPGNGSEWSEAYGKGYDLGCESRELDPSLVPPIPQEYEPPVLRRIA